MSEERAHGGTGLTDRRLGELLSEEARVRAALSELPEGPRSLVDREVRGQLSAEHSRVLDEMAEAGMPVGEWVTYGPEAVMLLHGSAYPEKPQHVLVRVRRRAVETARLLPDAGVREVVAVDRAASRYRAAGTLGKAAQGARDNMPAAVVGGLGATLLWFAATGAAWGPGVLGAALVALAMFGVVSWARKDPEGRVVRRAIADLATGRR